MSDKKKEFLRAVKFTLFSASAGIIQTIVFTLLNELLHFNYWGSYLPSLILSVLWNFTLNRKITFQSSNNVPIAMAKVALYYLIFTPLSTWGGDALVAIGWNEYVVLIGTMILNFVLEFLYDRFVVFGKTLDTAKKESKK